MTGNFRAVLMRLLAGTCVALLTTVAIAQPPPGAAGPPTAPPAPDPATYPVRRFDGGVVALNDVTYASQRGYRPLKLDLYLNPARTAPKALVIWLHGGAWIGGDQRGPGIAAPPFQNWPVVLASLAARGYVVAGVSYRLSGEAQFPSQIHDVKAAVRWLRANATTYGADPNRFVVWGGSAGGHLAALLGVSCNVPELEGTPVLGAETSSCVQGVVDFYAPIDFLQLDASRPAGSTAPLHSAATSAESRYLGCALLECKPAAVRLSNPIAFLDKADPPFLIMHGDADTTVPPQQSQLLHDALTAKGVKSELVPVPGLPHVFVGASEAQGRGILDKVFAFIDTTTGTTPAK